jgi:hypothetical protein
MRRLIDDVLSLSKLGGSPTSLCHFVIASQAIRLTNIDDNHDAWFRQ